MIQVKQEALPAAAVEGVFKTTSDKVVAMLSLIDKRETKGMKDAKRALLVHAAFMAARDWDYASAIKPKPRKKTADGEPEAEAPDAPETLVYEKLGRRQAEEALESIKQIVEEPNLTGYGARALAALAAELEEFAG